MVRTFEIYSPSEFQGYSMLLLTMVTMLSIRSPELIHLKTESLYLWSTSPLSPTTHNPWQQSLCYYEFNFFSWTPHIREIMQYLSFCVWLISLSIMFFRFIHVVTDDRVSIFLRLNNIPLCVCVCVCVCLSHYLYPFIRWQLLGLFPCLGYCE